MTVLCHANGVDRGALGAHVTQTAQCLETNYQQYKCWRINLCNNETMGMSGVEQLRQSVVASFSASAPLLVWVLLRQCIVFTRKPGSCMPESLHCWMPWKVTHTPPHTRAHIQTQTHRHSAQVHLFGGHGGISTGLRKIPQH